MSDEEKTLTINYQEINEGSFILHETIPTKMKKYKCRKCGSVCEGIGILFYKNETVGVERDYKFCWACWLNMHKQFCGEVDEVVDDTN